MRHHLQTRPSLIDTAEFRRLTSISSQPEDGPHDRPPPESGGRYDYSDDLLVKTDKFRKLELPELDGDFEDNPGVDPYNNATPGQVPRQ